MATLTVPLTRGFTIEQRGKVAVFSLTAPMTGDRQAEALTIELKTFFEEDWRQFVVDFTGVTCVTSTGFSPFLLLKQNLDQVRGGKLVLCGISSDALNTLAEHKLSNGFTIVDTKEQAFAAM